MSTVMTQINEIESDIKECEGRLDTIERTLRLSEVTDSERKLLKEEEVKLKKKVKDHDKDLKHLRKENWKNMFLSVMLMGLVYLSYHYIWAP